MMILQQTRGALSSGDQCSLDLPFAATKSLTARIGPTPTFTRASTATFVGSNGLIQTASSGAARFDHDSATGLSLGLRHESSATNRLLQSANFSTTWTANQLNTSGSPAWLDVTSSPDGQVSADKIIATTASTAHNVSQDVTLVTATTYSVSCYFKAGGHNFSTIAVTGAANSNVEWVAYFNLSTGAVGASNGFAGVRIFNAGNGWFRCVVSLTTTASGTLNIRLGSASASTSGGNVFSGNDSDGVFAWGAQLENGQNATTYIPTTTGTAVRSADLCGITAAAFSGFFNSSQGSWIVNANKLGADFNPIFQFEYSANSNSSRMYVSSSQRGNNDEYGMINNGTTLLSGNESGIGGTSRFCMSYAAGDGVYVRNGLVVKTSAAISATLPYDRFGFYSFNDAVSANGCIASFKYYRRRLSNAKLQALTL